MNLRLALAGVILLLTVVVMAAILMDLINVGFFVGPYRFSHWMSWAGSLWVAFYVPIYHYFKLHFARAKVLLDIHCFGFLIAFLLISIHFAGQMGRPVLPDLGEGIALYIVMLSLVITGLMQRFGLASIAKNRHYSPRFNRALHISLITTFYIVIVIHAASNVGLI